MPTLDRPKRTRRAPTSLDDGAASSASNETAAPIARPFVKWAGGKWMLAERIASLLPRDLSKRVYREPFVGGGAMFFWLQAHRTPKRAYLSDALLDLVRAYCVVRDDPARLVRALDRLRAKHSSDHYYSVRESFNDPERGSALERSSWLIYLNKTCFNGLYRTNRAGKFNVPIGRFAAPRVVDPVRIEAASSALRGASVEHRSYEHLLEVARPGEVIYLDPPYVPMSRTASFAAYAAGFGLEEQRRLADVFRTLDRRGCLLALSNSDTEVVRQLYSGFDLTRIVAPRSISAAGSRRVPVNELVVRNAARWPKVALPVRG